MAVLDHLLKLRPFVSSRAGDALIGIQTCEFPLFVGGNHFRIDLHLIGVGCELFFTVGRHPAVSCHTLLAMLCLIYNEGSLWLDEGNGFLWYLCYSHSSFSPSVISVPTLVWSLTSPELESEM